MGPCPMALSIDQLTTWHLTSSISVGAQAIFKSSSDEVRLSWDHLPLIKVTSTDWDLDDSYIIPSPLHILLTEASHRFHSGGDSIGHEYQQVGVKEKILEFCLPRLHFSLSIYPLPKHCVCAEVSMCTTSITYQIGDVLPYIHENENLDLKFLIFAFHSVDSYSVLSNLCCKNSSTNWKFWPCSSFLKHMPEPVEVKL